MKSTGIVRKVDGLGRVVLPKELRVTMQIDEKDGMEIFVDGNDIILRPYRQRCIFCHCDINLKQLTGVAFCPRCAKEAASRV